MGVVDHDGDDEVLKIVEQTSFDLDKVFLAVLYIS